MKQKLSEYNIHQNSMVLYCDNMGVINISKNPMQYSRTKHIDIHHHSICELVETNVISLEHVRRSVQLADMLTKPLKVTMFENLHVGLFVSLVNSNYIVMCVGFFLGYFFFLGFPSVARPTRQRF